MKPVSFSPANPQRRDLEPLAGWRAGRGILDAAQHCQGQPGPILDLLRNEPTCPPLPGMGQTRPLWEFFATVAATDLTAARALEPHLDAAAILAQAGMAWEEETLWGVYAAENPRLRVEARASQGTWLLDGRKPWCSLAASVTHALVSAHTSEGRRMFAVRMKQPGVQPEDGTWISRGLRGIPSGPVTFNQVPATPVGEPEWYVRRPGFAVGAVGVAACWFGGAVGVFRTLFSASQRREPDQLALAWLGEGDRLLAGAAAQLERAAAEADAGRLGAREAAEVRGNVARACERIMEISGHATGPEPLVADEDHARRVADLGIYVRQHHAARDDAALGRQLLAERKTRDAGPW